MYGTQEAIRQGRYPRSPSTRPARPVPGGPYLWDSRWAMDFSRTRTFPGNGSSAFPSPGDPPQPNLDYPFLPVAYCLLAHSRLGYSPKVGLDAAYHTTSCKSRSNTNVMCGQKIKRSPPFRSGRMVRTGARPNLSWRPSATAPSQSCRRGALRRSGIFYPHGFHNRSISHED